jgi:hypothetical protein
VGAATLSRAVGLLFVAVSVLIMSCISRGAHVSPVRARLKQK